MQGMTIGQVASDGQVTVEAIRFYEKEGLVHNSGRSDGGYRIFGLETVGRLHFINNAKRLGFTLKEIKELLDISLDKKATKRDVKILARKKMGEIKKKINDLKAIHAALQHLDMQCSGKGKVDNCPILHALHHKMGE